MKPPQLPQATLANWREAPYNRWAFHHVRELIPTADIANDPRRIRDFASHRETIDERFLGETDTDGCVILHRGRMVFEYYANGLTPDTPHILMSVTKSMLGLLMGMLDIDVERQVTD